MVSLNNIADRCSEIHELIALDKLSQVTKLLMDFVRDFSDNQEDLNEVIVIRSSFTRLDRRERQGMLSYHEAELERNKLLFKLLTFLDAVREQHYENQEKSA